jgi:hypothetical protein
MSNGTGPYDSDGQIQSIASSPLQHFNPHQHDPRHSSAEVTLNALRRENEHLKARLVDAERDCMRSNRLNEIYREEIVELRRRVSHPLAVL